MPPTILVVLGHPDSGSFNHAIARVVCHALQSQGWRVVFHDLYAEGFDPLLPSAEIAEHGPVPDDVRRHCRELAEADGIVIIHPNWWGQPPAILKGWIDRVFRPGLAYRFEEGDGGEGVPMGLLKAKAALIFNTSNTPDPREQAVFGDPLEALWKRCILDLCGVKNVRRRMFSVVCTSTPAQRENWLHEVNQMTVELFANPENG
ncbi:MAG: NAD(P)H-dependent oxidoreductase [Desulfobacteraceae bacterium]|nr:NAD(P)H-dependent oxidoreductase [Desulfobacteraceae bacterium]